MRNIIILIFLCFTISSYAQSSSYMGKIRWKVAESEKFEANKQISPYNLDLFKEYSKAATNYQYGAAGCAAVSAGLLIGYGCIKDKYEINESGDSKMTGKAKGLIIGGSTFAALAIVLEMCSINLKTKANKYLQLHLSGNQAALSYSF